MISVKQRLALGAVLPVLMAVCISLVLFNLGDNYKQANVQQRDADQLVKSTLKLNRLTRNYIHNPSDTNDHKWHAAYSSVSAALGRLDADQGAQATELTNIKKRHEDVLTLFKSLPKPGAESLPEDAGSDISGKIDAMVVGSLSFASMGQIDNAGLQQRAYMILVMVVVALSLLLTIIAVATSSRISGGVQSLKDGTQLVSAGNLDHLVPVSGKDEFTALATSFNEMTSKLKTAQSELSTEVEEHKKTSEELRESNVQLSDALVKLQRAQDQMVQQGRVEALRQVSTGIIRDINEALTPVVGISEMLLQNAGNLSAVEDLDDHLQTINHAAKQATNVVDQLSDYFVPRKQQADQTINVNEAVEEALTLVRSRIEQSTPSSAEPITINTNLSSDPLYILASQDMINKIVTNLLFNAAEASAGGGSITLSTSSAQGNVIIEVTDEGTGMNEEARKKALEPFYSTKGVGASGMGLTVVSGLVQQQNGDLEISSESGRGTRVSIKLPAVEAAPTPEKDDTQKSSESSRSLNILSVDDETWTLKLLERSLKKMGHTIVTCERGEDGIKAFKEGNFDLVITDRAMPDINGDKLAAEIKALSPSTPVFMLTGFGHMMEESGERPEHVDMIIKKPFTINDIKEAVASAASLIS